MRYTAKQRETLREAFPTKKRANRFIKNAIKKHEKECLECRGSIDDCAICMGDK
jgi:hypothetical protein